MTAIRLGQKNATGDVDALFRDKFIPELLAAFHAKRIMQGLVRKRMLDWGKSGSFPMLGTTSASYHAAASTSLLGNQSINKSEITINVDPFLISDVMLTDFDVALEHFDTREEIFNEMAIALANKEDKQLLQVAVLAARAPSVLTGRSGGSQLFNVAAATSGTVLAAMINSAGVIFDEKFVPETDRTAVVKSYQYNLLSQTDKITDKNLGGGGDYAKGTVGFLNNIAIVKSENLPTTNILEDSTAPNNTYHGDFSNTVCSVFNKNAVGTVSLKGIDVEKDYMLYLKSTLVAASVLQGHGILRSDCAIEISKEDTGTAQTTQTVTTTN